MGTTRARRVVVAAALAVAGLGSARPAGAAPPAGAQSPEAQEAQVTARIAMLTDQAAADQAALVAAQSTVQQEEADVAAAHAEVAAVAADAYMESSPEPVASTDGPAEYYAVAVDASQRLLQRLHQRLSAARADESAASEALGTVRRTYAQLDVERQALEVLVAADEAAQARRQAEAAAALAASDAARQAALASMPLTGGHAAAEAAQQAELARYPFGPAASVPAGLRPTGAIVAGIASWYGPGFDGRPTATGAIYDENLWTVASPDLPLGTLLYVTAGQRSVLLLVNDRGPYVGGRVLDLSWAAARALGSDGLIDVVARPLTPV